MSTTTPTTPLTTGRSRLPLWGLVAIALATVGPTMAMSGNAQGLVGSVGKGVPLVLVLGLVGVSLVAFGFVTLTRHMNHAGSAYALVGKTVGPRAGFFSGFAMVGAYIMLTICIGGIFAAFVNSFLAQLQNDVTDPYQLPWIVPVLFLIAGAALLAARDIKRIAQVFVVIEGVGIAAMIILAAVIFAKGGAPTTGIDFSAFTFGDGVAPSAVLSGTVIAFFSWVGFEASAACGEESTNPRRNIPMAVAGTVVLLGVLYITVIFAQTVGFGTDEAGLAAMQSSGNTLGDLGDVYIGTGFSLLIVFTAVMSAFAAKLACASAASRLMFAFGRDGIGPRSLSSLDGTSGTPRRALLLVLAVSLVVNVASWATGWPNMGTGTESIDTYVFFAIAATVALIVCYLMIEVAGIKFVLSASGARESRRPIVSVILLALGAALILAVLRENFKGQFDPLSSPAYWGLAWCGIGFAFALGLRKLTRRIGESLTAELLANDSDVDVPVSPAAPVLSVDVLGGKGR